MTTIIILALIGLCISVYTYLLERKVRLNPEYQAACDISDHISCTKPMFSKYANIFYFSNAVVAIAYYIAVALLAASHALNVLFFISLAACCASVYLGYLLYFKIKSLCMLCTSLYIINFLICGLVAYKLYS